jgi:hypothetical protein
MAPASATTLAPAVVVGGEAGGADLQEGLGVGQGVGAELLEGLVVGVAGEDAGLVGLVQGDHDVDGEEEVLVQLDVRRRSRWCGSRSRG